jgi:membrane protein DedA with SNARE-associated domain
MMTGLLQAHRSVLTHASESVATPLQAEQTPEWLSSLFTSEVGYLVFFVICVLEGAMLLRFMPSELVVPSALLLIGSSPSTVVTIVALAVTGTTVGQVVLFYAVRQLGRGYLVESRWLPVTDERLDRFDDWFERWGRLIVPVSNSLLFVRGLFTFPAGLSEMRTSTFLVLSAAGSLTFQSILASMYLFAGEVVV